ncbi:MAG: 5'/3'-nucleotidase SurE [Chlorobi bacterium]|nr:5'/3'-nucleotidase SurE [Chlorobiota bacterium]
MEKEKPIILVTNDDGPQAGGIKALLEVVRPLGEVYAVIPAEGQSGMSHAITVRKPIFIEREIHRKDFHYYEVSGTPVDCVKLAIHTLLPRRPDLILSGINHGSNASVNVIYSGTMGAALEGAINRIPSVGFSINSFSPDADFTDAAVIAGMITRQVLENPGMICLNVNIPAVPGDQIKGIQICRQTAGYWSEDFEPVEPQNGKPGYLLTGVFHNAEPETPGTDEWALRQGYVAIVPVHPDFTSHEEIEPLARWNLEEMFFELKTVLTRYKR